MRFTANLLDFIYLFVLAVAEREGRLSLATDRLFYYRLNTKIYKYLTLWIPPPSADVKVLIEYFRRPV
jgi:hypothetical protein